MRKSGHFRHESMPTVLPENTRGSLFSSQAHFKEKEPSLDAGLFVDKILPKYLSAKFHRRSSFLGKKDN
jgi:hypothetical protein